MAVVEQLGVDALQKGGALIDQVLAHPHQEAQILDVCGRDPRLRQPSLMEQIPQVPGIQPVGLGSLLLAPHMARVSAGSARGVAHSPLFEAPRPQSATPWWLPARMPPACRRTGRAKNAGSPW
jgi:hypothetical protein